MAELSQIYNEMKDIQRQSTDPLLRDIYNDAVLAMYTVIMKSFELDINLNEEKKIDSVIETCKDKVMSLQGNSATELNGIVSKLEEFKIAVENEILFDKIDVDTFDYISDEEPDVRNESPFQKVDVSNIRSIPSESNLSMELKRHGSSAENSANSKSTTRSNTPSLYSRGSSPLFFKSEKKEVINTAKLDEIGEDLRMIDAWRELLNVRDTIIQELRDSVGRLSNEKWLGVIRKDNSTTIKAIKELINNLQNDPEVRVPINAQVKLIKDKYATVNIEQYSQSVRTSDLSTPTRKHSR